MATDLDGTLLAPGGALPARTVAAVAAARRAGIHVVPVTGRPPHAVWRLAAAAGLGPLGVCSNGAVLVDLDHQEVLEVDLLPGEVAVGLLAEARAAEPTVRFALDTLERLCHETAFFDDPGPVGWDETIVAVDDLAPLLVPGCVKLIARRPGLAAPELMARLAPRVGARAELTTSGLDWVDIGLVGVSKATALARACQRLGVDPTEVIAVGDNHNDLSMLAWAGHAVAVANAVPDVLGAAARIVPANAEEGVALLLEGLLAGHAAAPAVPRPPPVSRSPVPGRRRPARSVR